MPSLQMLQCGYFFLALLNDVVGTNERSVARKGKLQKARDWVFTSLAFPLGTVSLIVKYTCYLLSLLSSLSFLSNTRINYYH